MTFGQFSGGVRRVRSREIRESMNYHNLLNGRAGRENEAEAVSQRLNSREKERDPLGSFSSHSLRRGDKRGF